MKKRIFSTLLALCMLLCLMPTAAFAEDSTETPPVCSCETACTADNMNKECPVCGAENAIPQNCGQYIPVEDRTGENGSTERADDPNGPTELSAADQVQAMINGLPNAEEITEDNAEEVEAQLEAIDEAKEKLSDEEIDELDMTRYAEAAAALGALAAPMLLANNSPDEQFSLTPGGRYYFDLSAMNIPGTANGSLPDSTLHYVPFTYAGTIEAYKLTSAMATTEEYAQQNKYAHSLFVADYAVTHTVSWNGLNDEGLIFGKNYASGGVDYTLRAPSVGSNATGSGDSQRGVPQSNEWDAVLNKNSGYIQNWNRMYLWGQDVSSVDASYRARRGYSSARNWYSNSATGSNPSLGFRPVLEVLNPDTLGSDGMKVVTLDLNGGKLGGSSDAIHIIVKTGSEFTAPASDGLTRTVSLDRTITLRPSIWNGTNPKFSWTIDGQEVGIELSYTYTPTETGIKKIVFTVTDTTDEPEVTLSKCITRTNETRATLEFTVECHGEEESHRRPASGASSATWDRVYEYTPAPGQFINELVSGGFTGTETTPEAAVAYAEERMRKNTWVSLGGWGGYIVVGFDHSIDNSSSGYKGGYNFSITGNAFKGSSEPGIVYVMQDTNGNTLPDDEWYELKGSEFGKEETVQDYAVTYYRPTYSGADVQWKDNQGVKGKIDYLKQYHDQPSYYPAWIGTDSYTLYGPCLKSRTYDQSGNGSYWVNGEYDWGYADNFGNDRLSEDDNAAAGAMKVYFKISNAVDKNGQPANLKYIDFIRVQTGVNAKAGWLGENSTEVFGFTDENINQGK